MLRRIGGFRVLLLLSPLFSVVLVLLILLPWPFSQEKLRLPVTSARPAETKAAASVTIQARHTEVQEILRTLAQQVGVQLQVDSAITGKMSLVTRDSKLEDAMDAICYSFDCKWQLDAGSRGLLVKSRQPDEPVHADTAPGLS